MSPKVSDIYKQQKKEQILEAARRAFIQKGYDLTTMKDIVDESGLSRGGVYLYFSSPEEVFLEIMKANDNNLISMVNNLNTNDRPIWEVIKELTQEIKKMLLYVQNGIEPVIFEYFMTSKRNDKVQKLLNERFINSLDCLMILINKGIQRNEFTPVFQLDEISIFLLTFLDGLEINVINHGTDKIKLDSQINQMILYLKSALMVKEEIEERA
jgi:AcrR family transcriptional regulator